jgi:hypothetical protein
MAKSDSPFSHALKRAVNQSTENSLLLGSLPPTALKILDVYRAGGTAGQAARQCHCSKQNVSKHTKMLLKRGLIRLQTCDVFKIYSLTRLGQSIFTMSEGAGEVVVLEDHAFKFAIIRNEGRLIDWKKLGNPCNWQKLGVHIDGLRVERTSKNIIIHPGKMVGFSPDVLLVDSGRAIQKCRDILEVKFGMLLSAEGVALHEPILRFYSEEAREDVKHGTVIVHGVGTTDNSPPEHIPHEEYSGVERAKARILLPDAVKGLNAQVSDLRREFAESEVRVENVLSIVETLVGEQRVGNRMLERLVDTLDRLFKVGAEMDKIQSVEANASRSSIDYVS